MNDFLLRKITPDNAFNVVKEVGFDEHYIQKAIDKYNFTLFKIYNLSAPQASIIKQLALSLGTDAAVHREVITCKIEKSDVLIAGTVSQLKCLAKKLELQPFKLKNLGQKILNNLESKLIPINIRGQKIDWAKKTHIMGILNVTPDSFSDGGKFNSTEIALKHAEMLINDGADIIDIGGESTRPFASPVTISEELKRVVPVIKAIRKEFNTFPISIDTRNSAVASEAIKYGVDIINDISGLDNDPKMLDIAIETQVPLIIMHSLSDPQNMQINPKYSENIIDEIYRDLSSKITKAIEAGVKSENIIIDPGIGFGKTLEHNLEILKKINEFTSLNCPLLIGISRKSIIAKIAELPIDEREEANIALNAYAASNGANIIRVHDVKKHAKAFKVLDKVLNF